MSRECLAWMRNPLVNPDTGRKITADGPTYKKWVKKCNIYQCSTEELHRSKSPQYISPECERWFLDPLVNPYTRRKIKRSGPTYQKLRKECGSQLRPFQ
jgi:2-cysteine adaptor domain